MRLALAASLIALIVGATPTSAPAQDYIKLTPEQVGQIFCIATIGNDMAPVYAILTTDLLVAIDEAETKDAAYEEANPGEKPPLGDGIPWQSQADYASECTVGSVTLKQDEADVAILHGFPDYPEGNFTDTLQLKLSPPTGESAGGELVWRIDNVSYASEGDLKTTLLSIFAN